MVVLRIHEVDQINSTLAQAIANGANLSRENGNYLILEGAHPAVMATLEKAGTVDARGPENVILAGKLLTDGLDRT